MPHCLIPSYWGLGFIIWILGGNKHSVYGNSCDLTLKIIIIHSHTILYHFYPFYHSFWAVFCSWYFVLLLSLSAQKPLNSEPFSCLPLPFKIFISSPISLFLLLWREIIFFPYPKGKCPLLLLCPPQRDSAILIFIILISLDVWYVFPPYPKANRFYPKNSLYQ